MNPNNISGDTKVAEALSHFYRQHGLGDRGGEDARWAKVKMGWFHFYIPNPEMRKRALFFHDVHHLATGYRTDLRSEAEIGAWEIASSCRNYWAAWILNFFAFSIGLVIAPRRTFFAFVRGKHSHNLYDEKLDREAIKEATVDAIRNTLNLNAPPAQLKFTDVLMFVIWSIPLAGVILAIGATILWYFGMS